MLQGGVFVGLVSLALVFEEFELTEIDEPGKL
jgi:hypothetical protein